MFLRVLCFARPFWFITIVSGCLVLNPHSTCGQGISLTGVAEGSVIVLPAGAPATSLAVTAIPSNPSGTTNVAFILERHGSVVLTRTSPPPYSVTLSNLTAGKYFLTARLVAAGTPPSGDVSFDIQTASASPANDFWSNAAVLAGVNVTAVSSNTYATSEAGEPAHAGTDGGKSVWWSWTAVSNGTVTATTAGSSFDTVLAVYRGTNLATLAEVAANDDVGSFSQATFFATNGTTYYFAVDGATGGGSGKAQLRLVASSPPAISITLPADGAVFLVASPSVATNSPAAASVSDPAGIARVEYWFDGGSGVSWSGVLGSPYQLNLTNLLEGHYVLTLMASNNVGLVSITNAGLSVISLAPVLVADGFVPGLAGFQLGITGFKGPTYTLLASTNLDVWCGTATWTNFAGAQKVADTNATLLNRRFYRASSAP